MTEVYVLAEDTHIVPVADLSHHLQDQIQAANNEYAITRPNSRVPSKIIDANAAQFLKQFEKPMSLVEAILEHSRKMQTDAQQVLEDAYPLIESCLSARLLVAPGAAAAKIAPSFEQGETIAGCLVIKCIQALNDSELYQVQTADGQKAAVKLARREATHMKRLLIHEEEILKRLDGAVGPKVIASGELQDGRRHLLIEWFDGVECTLRAQMIRQTSGPLIESQLLELCTSIIDAYVDLHAHGVIHSDVHPRNVLVSEKCAVRLIDFGMARIEAPERRSWPRAGIGFFFEPEYARALLHHHEPPHSTFAAEQYALAALLYLLITGQHYLDFVFGKEEMLRQIAEDSPVPLSRRLTTKAVSIEAVLFRALAKDPADRFASTGEFAAAFRKAASEMPGRIAIETESDSFIDEMINALSHPGKIPAYNGPGSPELSVTYGAAGIAYALLRIARVRGDCKLLAQADLWSELASLRTGEEHAFYHEDVEITSQTVGLVSPYHTASGVAAVRALIAHARCDSVSMEQAIEHYLNLTSLDCNQPDLTLGRSSILLGLTLLAEAAGPKALEMLGPQGDALLEGIWRKLDEEPAIRESKNLSYLGMAHGWAGTIYAALRWARLTGTPPYSSLGVRLDQLADLAVPTSKGVLWPVQNRETGGFPMPGWCNGGAGHVFLWTLAHRLFSRERFLKLAIGAAEESALSGGGGHSLCCGWAGQAYALLALYNHTGEKRWLEHARTLASRALAFAQCRQPGLPYSLYKGDLGVAVLLAEIQLPEIASMPFFDEEGWT